MPGTPPRPSSSAASTPPPPCCSAGPPLVRFFCGGPETPRLAADDRPARSIIGHLVDAANLLSLAGLLSSAAGIGFAVNARFPEAGVCLVLAFLADVYDGPVAKRLKSRTDVDRAFGANLDSLICS